MFLEWMVVSKVGHCKSAGLPAQTAPDWATARSTGRPSHKIITRRLII